MAESHEEADFIFVNTCSIREKAANRVIGHLKRLKALKVKNPALLLGVGGCVAEQEGRRLIDEAPWVNLVVGPNRLDEIPQVVENLKADMPPVILAGQKTENKQDKSQGLKDQTVEKLTAGQSDQVDSLTTAADSQPVNSLTTASNSQQVDSLNTAADSQPTPMSSYLTIMSGCDNYCAYCVVPYLRGPEISRSKEEVLAEAEDLVSRGSLEITLLGQNVNSFGRPGHRGGEDFVDLLSQVSKIPGLERLRFTTSHPKDFPKALVNLFGHLPNLCEHLHLPLQAGSDRILSAMGRRYNIERYLDLVSALRQVCPDIALSTDIIVGFPGETEEEYLQTVDVLKKVRFDSIYSFKYSDRPMTKANQLPDKILEEEKQRRLTHLQTIQKSITLEKHKSLIGRTMEVLVEGFGRRPGQLSGRTRDMKLINFDGPAELLGKLTKATVLEAWPVSLIGQMAR
jgi:tRNA-2-methylthio-N6-dimethylallyladenosine synthase